MLSNLPTLAIMCSDGDASKKSKRRSLLPQFNRKTSGEEKPEAGIKEEDEETQGNGSRPTSEDTRISEESFRRRAIDEDRKAMPPPPSRLSRPVSMIPPRGASQFARTHQSQVHTRSTSHDKEQEADANEDAARAASLAALTGGSPTSPSKPTIPESGLKRSGSSRLPQSPRVGGPALGGPSLGGSAMGGPVIPSRTTSSRNVKSHSRAVTSLSESTTSDTIPEERVTRSRTQAQQAAEDAGKTSPPRSAVTRSRPTSQVLGQQTATLQSSVMSRGRPGSQIQPPTSKPAFNTFQQHYSPAKSALPKPPLPLAKSYKPSPVVEEELAVTFDIAKQQIELLQLSLLHQVSSQCTHEFAASAKRKLSRMHTKLRKEYETTRATELVHQRVANLSALESWCRDPSLLVENLQILSLVYSDLTSLMEDGSRHGDVLRMFELWMNEAEAPLPGIFIQPLPDEWRAAHASLALKLRSIQRTLGVLPPPHTSCEEDSGLHAVLKGCKSLVDGMLRELDVMVKLEKDLLARETNKIEEEVKGLILDDVGMQNWVPTWQSVA